MRHQQLTAPTPAPPAISETTAAETAQPVLCDRRALEQLTAAYARLTSIAVLVDQATGNASRVVDRFVATCDADTDAIRIVEPFLDSMTFMRQVIGGLGFQTADLSLADLESILRMFLSYQKTHHRRTVICFEETQDQSAWVLDKMCQLVELEERKQLGLFVILIGRQDLVAALTEPPLDALSGLGRTIISVAPFNLQDTRELVRRCVESDGRYDALQVFDFQAVRRIYKLSAGVPAHIGSLCGECIDMLDKQNETVVSSTLVSKAAHSLGLYTPPRTEELDEADAGAAASETGRPSSGQLIVRRNGRVVQTLMVDKESILIGRDQRCDICIASPVVSRQHALIVNAPSGVKLVDLGSTNGSRVNGERVERCPLNENEVIVVGDCRIEFVAADYGPIEFETHRDVFARPDEKGDSAFAEEEGGTRLIRAEHAS